MRVAFVADPAHSLLSTLCWRSRIGGEAIVCSFFRWGSYALNNLTFFVSLGSSIGGCWRYGQFSRGAGGLVPLGGPKKNSYIAAKVRDAIVTIGVRDNTKRANLRQKFTYYLTTAGTIRKDLVGIGTF